MHLTPLKRIRTNTPALGLRHSTPYPVTTAAAAAAFDHPKPPALRTPAAYRGHPARNGDPDADVSTAAQHRHRPDGLDAQ